MGLFDSVDQLVTGFIPPMLAKPFPDDYPVRPGELVAEEKYDGHRLVLEKRANLVVGWSRNGLERALPGHVVQAALRLPDGTYDGELMVPGRRSFGVVDKTLESNLVYVAFDVLHYKHMDVTRLGYAERRCRLVEAFRTAGPPAGGVVLAWSLCLDSKQDIDALACDVWKRDGEGLIIKTRGGRYVPGKRSSDFMKIKNLRSAVLTITGFREGRLGPCSIVMLCDADGNETTVKTRNTIERERICQKPLAFVGRQLRIEFQERTPDGGYRHGRWDRLEDE